MRDAWVSRLLIQASEKQTIDQLHLYWLFLGDFRTQLQSYRRAPIEDRLSPKKIIMATLLFRVADVSRWPDGFAVVKMNLCADHHPQLDRLRTLLTSHFKNEELNRLKFGHALWIMGKLEDSENFCRGTLAVLPVEQSNDIAKCYFILKNIALENGKHDARAEYHQKFLEIKKQLLNDEDPSMGDNHNRLDDLKRMQGNMAEAWFYHNWTFTIWRESSRDPQYTIAMCLNTAV